MARLLEERIAEACRLNKEFPLQTLADRPATQITAARGIPLQCFQTAEHNRFGKNHHTTLLQLRERNPELTFRLFDAQQRDAYMQEHWGKDTIGSLYRRSRFGAMRADIFRYCVIYDQGGFYLDINKLILKPLLALTKPQTTALISFERTWCQIPAPPNAALRLQHPDRYLVQWCFGFAAGHPLLAMMLESICRYANNFENFCFANPGEAIRSLTGPGLFTQIVREFMEHDADPNLIQAGIDFHGSLRYPAGREVMYLQQPHYKSYRNQPILDPPAG